MGFMGIQVTSEADLEDLHSRIAALRTSHESGEHEVSCFLLCSGATKLSRRARTASTAHGRVFLSQSTTAGSDTTPPLSGSAYDRSLVELAAIREAAAAAKLRSLTDRLLAAVHRLQRQKPTVRCTATTAQNVRYPNRNDVAYPSRLVQDHSLSAFSNGAHLYRSRQLKYFTQLKSLVTEAARYLNADNQSLVVARVHLGAVARMLPFYC